MGFEKQLATSHSTLLGHPLTVKLFCAGARVSSVSVGLCVSSVSHPARGLHDRQIYRGTTDVYRPTNAYICN